MSALVKLRLHRPRRLVDAGDRRLVYRAVDLTWLWFFSLLLCMVAYIPARIYAETAGDIAATSAMLAWVVVAILAATVHVTLTWLHSRNAAVARLTRHIPLELGVLPYLVAGSLAGAFFLAAGMYQLPRSILWTAWPLFFPGLIIMARRYRQNDQPGLFPRPATRRAAIYSLVAALTVLIAALWMPVIAPTFGDVSIAAINPRAEAILLPLLTFGMLMAAYSLTRQSDLARFQASVLTRAFERAIQAGNYAQAWPLLARSIQQHFGLKRVIIITPDEHYREARLAPADKPATQHLSDMKFYIEGFAGQEDGPLETHNHPARTIALSVLMSAHSRIVHDVAALKDEYLENGPTDTRSEMYVPVLDLEREDEVIAILVVQDTHRWAFSSTDQNHIERVADYLATFSRQLNQNVNLGNLQEVMASLDTRTEPGMQDYLDAARRVFATSHVASIPLAFATHRPIVSDALAMPAGFIDAPGVNDFWLDARSGIPNLIRTWQPVLITALNPGSMASYWQPWAESHGLQAIALLPVGDRDAGGALIVIGFPRSIHVNERYLHILLAAFAHGLATRIRRPREAWWTFERTFVASTIEMQPLLKRYDLGRDSLETTITTALQGDSDRQQHFGASLQALVSDLYDSEEANSPLTNHEHRLDHSLDRFANHLKERTSLSGVRFIDERIELESLELKTMLYRVLCEAMLNSLRHGHATTVNVIVARRRDTIHLIVQDDGSGFDPAQLSQRGEHQHGIVALCACLSELTGASPPEWLWTAPGQGACLRVSVPCLYLDDNLARPNRDIEQKMSRLEGLHVANAAG